MHGVLLVRLGLCLLFCMRLEGYGLNTLSGVYSYSIDCGSTQGGIQNEPVMNTFDTPIRPGNPYIKDDKDAWQGESSDMYRFSSVNTPGKFYSYIGEDQPGPYGSCSFARPLDPNDKIHVISPNWNPYLFPDRYTFEPAAASVPAIALLVDGWWGGYPTKQTCIKGDNKKCILRIWDKDTWRIIYMVFCHYTELISCTTTCNNGEYASGYAVMDAGTQRQSAKLTCLPCSPGTFNTCGNKASCTWTIPESGKNNVGADIWNTIQPPPVGSCFPCYKAVSAPFHFTDSPSKKTEVNTQRRWVCPGGAEPPRNCPSDDHVENKDFSKCVCKPGFYDPDGDGPRTECLRCEPGSYCAEGIKRACPPHTFQDEFEKTECKDCTSTRDETGIFSSCGQRKQLQFCGEGQTARVCVPCSQCKKAYLSTAVLNQVDCYKSH